MVKIAIFASFAEFEAANVAGKRDLLVIVPRGNGYVCADLITPCKKWKTAVKRFFDAIDRLGPEYDILKGWRNSILESCENSFFSDHEMERGQYTDGFSWTVESSGGEYYVMLKAKALGDADGDAEKVAASQVQRVPTVRELMQRYQEKRPDGHYFDSNTLRFFGESISDMRVMPGVYKIRDIYGDMHACYKLRKLSRNYPGGARVTFAYFDTTTFDDIIPHEREA